MTREEVILAALAPANGVAHGPVQVQKLLFLVQKRAASIIDGPGFDFSPYDYGPFDQSIYADLMALSKSGDVEILGDPYSKGRRYRLTPAGQAKADAILLKQNENVRAFLNQLSAWVRSLTFAQLVSAIYAAYPEMKVNSVFGR